MRSPFFGSARKDTPSGRKIAFWPKIQNNFHFFLITEIQAALIPLHIWRERYILITGGW
jgi:hypothetical protein